MAAQLIPIGWGEGLEQAATYLNSLPDGCQSASATWFEPVLRAFACGPVIRLPEPLALGRVEYAVLYIDQLQRENAPQATALIQQQGSAVYTVTLHGIPYATVYHLPQPVALHPNAVFGGQIRLQGVELVRSSDALSLTTQWQALTPIAQDYSMFVHVLDAQGNRVSQIDVPPAGIDHPTSVWRMGHFQYWRHPLPLPPDLDPGAYWLAIGLYDPATFARLPLAGASPPAPNAPSTTQMCCCCAVRSRQGLGVRDQVLGVKATGPMSPLCPITVLRCKHTSVYSPIPHPYAPRR